MARDPQYTSVVLGGSLIWYLLDLEAQYTIPTPSGPINVASQQGRSLALAALEKKLVELKAEGKKVFLLLGNPMSWKFDPAFMGDRLLNRAPRAGTTAAIDPAQNKLTEQLKALAARAGAEAIGPYGTVCSDRECQVVSDGVVPVFKDDSHFNPDWVKGVTFIDRTLVQ
jgi:hypothetical protein